jgi:Zn-dependent protease with chaperone function
MRKRLICGLLVALLAVWAAGPRKLPKAGWNLFSKQQDIQLGKEAAAQVEKQMTVIPNKPLTDYITSIGQRLVTRGGLDPDYPYSFHVVQDESINAFALPGGPMFVNTGLLKAVENEGQLAGVLAHELSHVVLRHGTSQASKAQGIQIIAMIGGALAGGNGSLMGNLAQMGIGLGANSVLLKYSRNAERDADLLGMHTMAKAGYDPIEMARFFEKIEAEAGRGNSKFAQFFSDHPNPGNRVQMVEQEIPYLPKQNYRGTEGNLKQMQKIVEGLPAAPKKAQAGPAGNSVKATQQNRPQLSGRVETYQGGGVSFSHPAEFKATGQGGNGVTLAPPEGVVQGQGGQTAIGYGILAGTVKPQSGRVNLDADTKAFLDQVAGSNNEVKVELQPQAITIGDSRAYVTKLTSESPFPGTREVDVIVTVDRQDTMYYFIFVSPENDYTRLEPIYQQVTQTIRFL